MYSIVVGEKNNALVMHLYSALEIAKNTIEDYLEVIKYSNKKVKEHIKIGKKLDDNKREELIKQTPKTISNDIPTLFILLSSNFFPIFICSFTFLLEYFITSR